MDKPHLFLPLPLSLGLAAIDLTWDHSQTLYLWSILHGCSAAPDNLEPDPACQLGGQRYCYAYYTGNSYRVARAAAAGVGVGVGVGIEAGAGVEVSVRAVHFEFSCRPTGIISLSALISSS